VRVRMVSPSLKKKRLRGCRSSRRVERDLGVHPEIQILEKVPHEKEWAVKKRDVQGCRPTALE